MDSVTLRKTHFKLGDYRNPYSTTTNEQNKNIQNKRSMTVATLDEGLKNDLRSSHFILGNFDSHYQTISQQEFYDKSRQGGPGGVDFKNIEKGLRSHNYVLGNDKPDYKSETQAKYVTPKFDHHQEYISNGQKIGRAHV